MNSLKEKLDSERVLPRPRLTKVRACMFSTSRKSACVRLPLSFSRPAVKLVCIFLFCVIWKIACVMNLVSLRRRSGLLSGINRKAGNEVLEQEFFASLEKRALEYRLECQNRER